MEKPSDHPRPIDLLLGNKQVGGYTAPAPEHYPHNYGWDPQFANIVYARMGYLREAVEESFASMTGMRQDGFVPNMRRAPKGRRWDMEWFTFNDWRVSSEYGQPDLSALAISETYEALGAVDKAEAGTYLEQIFPLAKKRYLFWGERQNSPDDPLLGVIHPHETGRDSDPTFDFIKHRLSRRHQEARRWINWPNICLDYMGAMAINLANKASGWELAEARKNFWVNDVMFNCMYVDNTYQMAALARQAGRYDDMKSFYGTARALEARILDKMWTEAGTDGRQGFYALGPDGRPIREVSISNLFPLVLPNLRPEQLTAIVDLMESSFDTPYPLPSVATDSPNYDPSYKERGRLWRGPKWQNVDWYLVERGLRRQAARPSLNRSRPELVRRCLEWADKITESSRATTKDGYYEFSDPVTGKGYRVEDFSMSTPADLL